MRNGVFLDTSFLITLADPTRERHAAAKAFFQHFLKTGMPMAISAISRLRVLREATAGDATVGAVHTAAVQP